MSYGLALFLAGVILGALLPPGALWFGYVAGFISQAGILGLLAYRSPHKPAVHALLALLASYLFSGAALYVASRYVTIPAEPLVLSLIGWSMAFLALATGVTIGSSLRRRHTGGA